MMKYVAGLAAGLAVMFTAASGQAQLNKCLDQIDGLSIKLFSTYAKALKKCKVAIQKETDAGAEADYVKAADACEKALGSLFDINAIRGKSALSKFYGKFNSKFFVDGGKCDSDLTENAAVGTNYIAEMGHLMSPLQAPGVSPWDWMMRWIALMKFKLAMLEETFIFATTVNLLDTVIDESGTDCSLPVSCDPDLTSNCRPNLCSTTINCRKHACQLAATSDFTVSIAGGAGGPVNVPLTGRSIVGLCKLNPITFGITGAPNVFAIIGDPARIVDPAGVLGQTVCIEMIRSQGWCDCAGLGIPKNASLCQDHNLAAAPSCTGTPSGPDGPEGECFCVDGSGAPTANRCGDQSLPCPPSESCGVTSTGDFCHDGTAISAVTSLYGGASGVGDCLTLSTLQLKILGPGDFGADGNPCTMDDARPPAAAVSVPLTTGTASIQITNAVRAPGVCSNNSNHFCAEDVNCLTNDPNNPSGTCNFEDINASQTLPSVLGVPISGCAALEASQLSGFSLVGAFPLLDTGALGDVASTVSLDCQ